MSNAVSPGRRWFSELRRRRIFRTAALYIVGTWLILQVADVVFPAMDIPERAIRDLLVAALLGFPAALIFSWFYDVGVHGIRRTGPAGADELAAAQPLRRSDYLILTAFAGVAAFILYSAVGNVIESPRVVRETRPDGPPMVAVLPFASSGLAGDSEFFATGVHDDLLTQLAKLQSIRVISRTSVLEYRNIVRNMREIGEELGVDAILEGGVRIAENRIRINAQLIDARTDEHLWAETYDRELSTANIFDVQSEIARAIAVALNATLTVQDSKQLTLIPTENMAAYRAYHRAMQIRDTHAQGVLAPEYRQALEEAVELDPTFSRAWAELVTHLAYLNFAGANPESTRHAEQALESLRAVAPESADYLFGLAAYVYYALKDYDRAHDIISHALTMYPSDVRAVELRSLIERRQGDFDAWVDSRREARTLDPRNPLLTSHLLTGLLMTHRYDEAWAEIESSPLENFSTGYTRSLLLFREHRDFKRLQESMEELCQLYEEADCEWNARVANRDYPGALDSLGDGKDAFEWPSFSQNDRRRILTYWLIKEDKLPTEGLRQWQSQLEADRDDSGDFRRAALYIGSAMLAGAQGNADESERLIQRFFRLDAIDWAERARSRHEACRVLGMIEATHAAVKCIRDGLEEASNIAPFLEPYLPVYDSLRDEPAFIEMIVEIDPEAPATIVH